MHVEPQRELKTVLTMISMFTPKVGGKLRRILNRIQLQDLELLASCEEPDQAGLLQASLTTCVAGELRLV